MQEYNKVLEELAFKDKQLEDKEEEVNLLKTDIEAFKVQLRKL